MKTAMLHKNISISVINSDFRKGKKKFNFYKSSLLCIFPLLFFSFIGSRAFANTISNNNFLIDVNNIDTNPQPSPKAQVLGISNVKTNIFTTGPNYTINTPNDSLTFKLSQDIIAYGILSSTNPVIRTSKISLNENIYGGEILSYEDHPLTAATKEVIENTSCDNGACTPETAASWTNTLTYGFGYRCDSELNGACDSQFTQSNYFKSYPDSSADYIPESVLFTTKGETTANITYKVNISGTQKTGSYNNSITYLAIPSF